MINLNKITLFHNVVIFFPIGKIFFGQNNFRIFSKGNSKKSYAPQANFFFQFCAAGENFPKIIGYTIYYGAAGAKIFIYYLRRPSRNRRLYYLRGGGRCIINAAVLCCCAAQFKTGKSAEIGSKS